MDYYYTFIKADEYITVSGNGGDIFTELKDITWTSSPGAAGVLKQLNDIESVYTPTRGFVCVNDYPNDMYVQIAKFGAIYKDGWRFQNTNLSPIEPSNADIGKSEVLEKSKTKKWVYVKATSGRKAHRRMQEVGREEIDPGVENLWELTLDEVNRLCTGDKTILKEKYVAEHSNLDVDGNHPRLKYIYDLMDDHMKDSRNPTWEFFDPKVESNKISAHERAVSRSHGRADVTPAPAHVMKDFPDLAYSYEIDISDEAVEESIANSGEITRLCDMTKETYDAMIGGIAKDYKFSPKDVNDKMLKEAYPEQLVDVKRAAKLRKKIYNNLPDAEKNFFTPDTMNGNLHRRLIKGQIRRDNTLPDKIKADYPTLFHDVPFTYTSTGNDVTDKVINDILTDVRDQCGYVTRNIGPVVDKIIGSTGEKIPTYISVDDDETEERIQTTVDEVSKLINSDLLNRVNEFGTDATIVITQSHTSFRASGGERITLGKLDTNESRLDSLRNIIAHEYGHCLERTIPEVAESSKAFLDKRTENDLVIKFADIEPQTGYDNWEEGKVDRFIDIYMGKLYERKTTNTPTEILSMGMGYLSTNAGRALMYDQDPELLGYVLAVVTGKIPPKNIEKGLFITPDKSETIEIDLYKLLNTTGLTRKRVLVKKTGGVPFWSTRWVQQGDTVKDTVEAAGFELVAEEGEEPEPISLKDLITSAYEAGKAAYEKGLPNRSGSDPKLKEITKQNPGSVKDEIAIHEGWVNGWTAANIAAPVPGVLDDPKPEDKGEISFELIKPAYEAGKATFRAGGSDVPGTNPGLAAIIREGNHTQATLEQLSISWKKGWDEESKKAPEPEPKTVKPSVGKVADIISNTERDFTIDVTPETQKQLDHFNLKNGVNFSGVSKKNMLSISDGLEKSVGKYGIKLGYIGWHQGKKRHPVPGKYVMYPAISEYQSITLHKTMTKNMVKLNEKDKSNFAYTKVTNIAGTKAKLEESVFESTINNYKRKLIKYENCNRWLVSNDAPDPLSSAVAHEGYHAVYFGNKLEEKWNTNLEVMPGYIGIDDPRCCTVSEYGVSSESELFAEVGAALAYDIDIDPEVKMAFERTVEGLL